MVNGMLIEKLGPVKKCDIELGQETILLGKNNSGKTYVSYLLYGIYKRINREKVNFLNEFLSKVIDSSRSLSVTIDKIELSNYLKNKIISDLNENIKMDLPKIFNTEENEFQETRIKIFDSDLENFIQDSLNAEQSNIQKFSLRNITSITTLNIEITETYWRLTLDEIDSFFTEDSDIDAKEVDKAFLKVAVLFFNRRVFAMPNILYIPAERNGINVFRKELSVKRSTTSFDVSTDTPPTEIYPLPISDYMKYLNLIDIEFGEKNLRAEEREKIWSNFSADILKGKYEYDSEQNEFYYREVYSLSNEKIKYKQKKIPLQIASSSIKSLFGLEYYLKFLFSKGDILFIDEPEMNLDPENQTKFADLLVELSNLGVKIIISSHSDYLVRSTTNKILKLQIDNGDLDVKIMGYYFEANQVRKIGNLSQVDYIDIFDDINTVLEDHYFLLKHMLADKNSN